MTTADSELSAVVSSSYLLAAFFVADTVLAAAEAPLAGLEYEILFTFPFVAVSFLAIF